MRRLASAAGAPQSFVSAEVGSASGCAGRRRGFGSAVGAGAPTPLRCSAVWTGAELTSLAALAPFKQAAPSLLLKRAGARVHRACARGCGPRALCTHYPSPHLRCRRSTGAPPPARTPQRGTVCGPHTVRPEPVEGPAPRQPQPFALSLSKGRDAPPRPAPLPTAPLAPGRKLHFVHERLTQLAAVGSACRSRPSHPASAGGAASASGRVRRPRAAGSPSG
jgi:hypothetical protein